MYPRLKGDSPTWIDTVWTVPLKGHRPWLNAPSMGRIPGMLTRAGKQASIRALLVPAAESTPAFWLAQSDGGRSYRRFLTHPETCHIPEFFAGPTVL